MSIMCPTPTATGSTPRLCVSKFPERSVFIVVPWWSHARSDVLDLLQCDPNLASLNSLSSRLPMASMASSSWQAAAQRLIWSQTPGTAVAAEQQGTAATAAGSAAGSVAAATDLAGSSPTSPMPMTPSRMFQSPLRQARCIALCMVC